MSDPYFQKLFADRIGGVNYGKDDAIYKFEKIKRAKRKALADYPDRTLIDFGIGENDAMAPAAVRTRMNEEINLPENRGYADNGVAVFKEAVARLMQRQFGVELDAATQVNHCIGSKTALSMIPAAFINPHDVTLMTVPGYPVAGTHTGYYGGTVHKLPLLAENDFLPDLDNIPADVLAKAKILVINYPNSPTGKVAPREFFAKVVDFAKANELIVVQDAAHIMLTYEGEPLSFLSVPGAMDVGVEVHSLSKGYDMIGWRIGWVCGNERIVSAFADVKDNCDSGQFIAVQKAAAAALDDDEIPKQTRQKYRRRLEKLVATLKRCGFQCEMPGGTYFLYSSNPKSAGDITFENAEAASQYLITQHSICTVPWDDAGAFLRFSVTYEAADEAAEDALMAETEKRLAAANLVFLVGTSSSSVTGVPPCDRPARRLSYDAERGNSMKRIHTTYLFVTVLLLAGCPSSDDGGNEVSLEQRYNEALLISSPTSKANRLIEVARDYYSAGDTAGGQKALDAAFAAASDSEEALGKAQAFNGVAAAEAEFGRKSKAEDALKQARRAANGIDDAGLQVEQLAMIAVTFGTKLDDPSKASAYLGAARDAAEGIADPSIRAAAIVDLAGSHHQLGQADEAAAMMATATEAVKQIEDPNKRADAIGKIAAKATEMKASNAEELFNEAISTAESIDDASAKANRLADLATALAMHLAGNTTGAQELLKKAIAASEQINEQALKTEVQSKIDGYRNRM